MSDLNRILDSVMAKGDKETGVQCVNCGENIRVKRHKNGNVDTSCACGEFHKKPCGCQAFNRVDPYEGCEAHPDYAGEEL